MSEILLESKFNKISLEDKKQNYAINIILSEPQVIDQKETFFIPNPESKKPRRCNSYVDLKPSALKEFTEEEAQFDRFLTSKVKEHNDFDDVVEDPFLKKFLK